MQHLLVVKIYQCHSLTDLKFIDPVVLLSAYRALKWSEYMSILFVIWNNDIGKGILDERGLFPEELKQALSVNRNAHAPVTESSRWSLS